MASRCARSHSHTPIGLHTDTSRKRFSPTAWVGQGHRAGVSKLVSSLDPSEKDELVVLKR